MNDLAVFARFMKFFAHMAHHFVSSSLFLIDHQYLNTLYSEYDELYDSIVERSIGLGAPVNEFGVTQEATNLFLQYKDITFSQNIQYFSYLATFEVKLRDLCAAANVDADLGLSNFLGAIADESQARQYKINQRIAQP